MSNKDKFHGGHNPPQSTAVATPTISATSTAIPPDDSEIQVDENVVSVPVTQIWCSPEWNARRGNWKEDTEYKLLLASVVSSEGRIKSPLEIRPVPKEYKNQTKCPYMLVAGFRRYMVALELKIPLVPCLIEEMTEAAARLRNIQENSTHENLRTCDQSWAIGQIKNKATQQEIAQKCGLSQPYVGKLLAIYDGLIPSVFKLWREQTLIKIPIAEIIELAKQPKDQQETSFRNLITEASKSRKGGAGKAAWVDAAIRKAHQFGSLLGRLARVGLVKVEENKDQWENRDVEKVIRLGKDANDEQVNSILEALLAGYKQSRDAKEKTTEGDTGETSIN